MTCQLSLFDGPAPARVARRGVAPTSKQAYAEITESGHKVTLREKIYTFILLYPGSTRAQIAQYSGIRLASVCGRVAELVIDGLVIERGTTVDKETGKTVSKLVATCMTNKAIG